MDGRAASWIVVGGGMVGCTLAMRLAQRGHPVTLLERAPEIGGLAAAWTVGPVTWDRYYHVILGSDSAWRGVLAELGLDESIVWRPTRTAALADGRLLGVSSPLELLRFDPLSPLQRVRLGATLAWATQVRDGRALEQVPVETWLRRLSGDRGFERFWKPLLRAKLGDAWPEASASFIWATAQRLGRARRNGLAGERFGYVPGGYATVTERYAARLAELGVTVRTGVGVDEVRSVGDRVTVMTTAGPLEADEVALTTPASVSARLVPQLDPREQSLLGQLREQGVVCVSLVLDRPLTDAYLTYLLDETILTGVVDMSSFVDPEQLGGHGLVYLPRYCPAGDPAFREPDDVVVARFSDALRAVYPDFAERTVVASGVARAPQVFSIPTLGYSDRVLPFSTSVPGVHLVNASQIVNGTLNVDESVQLAERAAATLAGSAGRRAPTGTLGALGGTQMTSRKPVASLSLDLDNEWAYLMTHGNPAWTSYPTYLPVVVPRVLEVLRDLDLKISFFVVGLDATIDANREPIAALAQAGHEIGNHSFRHQPWLHLYSRSELVDELARTEDALEAVTGQRPVGFRGPGYSLSPDVLDVLVERGYRYDASTLPTYIGPLSRAFYFRSAKLTPEQRAERSLLFGSWRDGRRPLTPYRWRTPRGTILEIPVTTLPGPRVPIHISYLLYLAAVRPEAATAYFVSALKTCALMKVEPSILLHPLDFLGADDVSTLSFFPAMGMGGRRKTELVHGWLSALADRFEVVSMRRHAEHITATRWNIPERVPEPVIDSSRGAPRFAAGGVT